MMQNIGRYPNEVRSQAEKQITVQSVVKVGQNLMLTVHAKGTEANWVSSAFFLNPGCGRGYLGVTCHQGAALYDCSRVSW